MREEVFHSTARAIEGIDILDVNEMHQEITYGQ